MSTLMKRSLGLIVIGWVITRLILFFGIPPMYSDVSVYAKYAFEYNLAKSERKTLHDYHHDLISQQIQLAPLVGRKAPPESAKIIEYPGYAVAWMLVPSAFFDEQVNQNWSLFQDEYKSSYRLWMLGADFILLLLLLHILVRILKENDPNQILIRGGVYVLASTILGHIWFDRLDLLLAVLIIAALYGLISKVPYLVGLFALVMAIHFKLVPVLLLPLFLIGSLVANKSPIKQIPGLIGRLLFVGLSWLFSLFPVYDFFGPKVNQYLEYHSDRGIQVESTYSSLVSLFSLFGLESTLVHGHGSFNISSSLDPLIKTISVLLPIILVGVVWVFFVRKCRFSQSNPATTIARLYSAPFILAVTATLVGAILLSKVFSPQYIVWVVPLVALLPLEKTSLNRVFALFIFICILTTILFPVGYYSIVLGKTMVNGNWQFEGPGFLGGLLLLLRNGALIGLAIYLARSIKGAKSAS